MTVRGHVRVDELIAGRDRLANNGMRVVSVERNGHSPTWTIAARDDRADVATPDTVLMHVPADTMVEVFRDPVTPPAQWTANAVTATADLIARLGAASFQVGYLNEEDDPDYAERGPEWVAQAFYKGARLASAEYDDPAAACIDLACKVLDGGKCQHCGRESVAAVSVLLAYYRERPWMAETVAVDGRYRDGLAELVRGRCVWRLDIDGQRWVGGCE